MKGITLKGSKNSLDSNAFKDIVGVGAKYIALTPYAYCNPGSSKLFYDLSWQYWGEKTFGIVRCVELARKQELKVLLKPQVWIMNGSTGNLDFDDEKEWKEWSESYRKYILHYAEIAEKYSVAAFSIGSEFRVAVEKHRPFWRSLIDDVREIYHGKITYSANWNEFESFPLWESLDFIGVNSYFPLSKKVNPRKKDLMNGWDLWIDKLEEVSYENNRPVVFTKFGYRSMQNTIKKPWNTEWNYRSDPEIQKIAYEVFFEELWAREWMKGAFIWNWDARKEYNSDNNKFSPQGKPAELVLRRYFGV